MATTNSRNHRVYVRPFAEGWKNIIAIFVNSQIDSEFHYNKKGNQAKNKLCLADNTTGKFSGLAVISKGNVVVKVVINI